MVPSGTVDLGGGGGAVVRGGGGVVPEEPPAVFENEPAPEEPPVVFENEPVPEGAYGRFGGVEELFDEVEELPVAFLAAVLDATVRVGMPSETLLHPVKASAETVSAVGRFSGERYLHPAKARGPMLVSFPST